VQWLYGTNPNQNINIYLALPLSAADRGTGDVQGALIAAALTESMTTTATGCSQTMRTDSHCVL